MGIARLGRSIKRPPLSFGAKVSLVFFLGLVFVVTWWTFSSPSASAFSLERRSFGDIESLPVAPFDKKNDRGSHQKKPLIAPSKDDILKRTEAGSRTENEREKEKKKKNDDEGGGGGGGGGGEIEQATIANNETNTQEEQQEDESEDKDKVDVDGQEEVRDTDNPMAEDREDGVEANAEDDDGGDENTKNRSKKKKKLGPLFDPKMQYTWRLCSGKTGFNYIPCVDMEGGRRHRERSCPRTPIICV